MVGIFLRKHDVIKIFVFRPGRIFLHFRLSRWIAKHLRMRSATPSVYLEVNGKTSELCCSVVELKTVFVSTTMLRSHMDTINKQAIIGRQLDVSSN